MLWTHPHLNTQVWVHMAPAYNFRGFTPPMAPHLHWQAPSGLITLGIRAAAVKGLLGGPAEGCG